MLPQGRMDVSQAPVRPSLPPFSSRSPTALDYVRCWDYMANAAQLLASEIRPLSLSCAANCFRAPKTERLEMPCLRRDFRRIDDSEVN